MRRGLIRLKQQDFIARADCLGFVTVGRRDDWGVGARLDNCHGVTTDADGRLVRLNHSSNGQSREIPRRSETSLLWPGVSPVINAVRSSATSACTLLLRPPRERPIAWRLLFAERRRDPHPA